MDTYLVNIVNILQFVSTMEGIKHKSISHNILNVFHCTRMPWIILHKHGQHAKLIIMSNAVDAVQYFPWISGNVARTLVMYSLFEKRGHIPYLLLAQ